MKSTTPESDVLKQCLQYLALRKIDHFRLNVGGAMLPGKGGKQRLVRFGVKGLPDILGWLPINGVAVTMGLEIKRKGGRVRPEQRAFLDRLREAGGVALLVSSVDELIRGLDEATGGKG